MCGGIALDLKMLSMAELEQFFLPAEIDAFRASGRFESFFWARRPVLPYRAAGATDAPIHLIDWGNREKAIDLPKTGWAREDSLAQGKWRHLSPQPIAIPAQRGVEKKVWFDIAGTIAGVIAERDGVARAYMITVPADEGYRAMTGHDRMPKIS